VDVQRFEIRRAAVDPGWTDVFTNHVRVFRIGQGLWPQQGRVPLLNADGGCSVWLTEDPRHPGVVVVDRLGQRRYTVRRAMAPHGTGHWTVSHRDALAMEVFGDMLAAHAIVSQDARVVAEVAAEGLGEYSVTCQWGVDPPLVLGVVLAIDHLGS
jgi:hypothetical protein